MRVLVGCECSGRVRDAFLAKGHDALSCDVKPSETPGPHYQGDIRDILFDRWDMGIFFPPCTYLAYSGLRHWNKPGRAEKREEALHFVRLLLSAPIPRIALENPKGCITKEIRRETQVIHPYYFGDIYTKYTCLWLQNLPPLMATHVATSPLVNVFVQHARGGNQRQSNRSRTFPGIAQAMADQWNYS